VQLIIEIPLHLNKIFLLTPEHINTSLELIITSHGIIIQTNGLAQTGLNILNLGLHNHRLRLAGLLLQLIENFLLLGVFQRNRLVLILNGKVFPFLLLQF
jgi:hypothetical protein